MSITCTYTSRKRLVSVKLVYAKVGYYTPNISIYQFQSDKSFPIGLFTSRNHKLLGLIQPALESIRNKQIIGLIIHKWVYNTQNVF
jgi:hypothetical protein